jgi:hypothetical protein
VLVVGSSEAITRGYVEDEVNIAQDERALSRDFRLIPLRLAGADVGRVVRGISWIDLPSPALTESVAAAILRAFHPGDHRPDPQTSRDVYVSMSWRASDNASALAVCRRLSAAGFRLIGDAKDQKGFRSDPGTSDRLCSIVQSCGAFVGVIPYRGTDSASTAKENPYHPFLRELDLAAEAELPTLVVADPRVHHADGDDHGWLPMEAQADACPAAVETAIEDLWSDWKRPSKPHYVFFAVDLEAPFARRNSELRELIERITGMSTVVGNEIHEQPLHEAIMRKVKEAFLVIADITGGTEETFNLNVCIEAGMALAAEKNLELLAAGRSRRPPFTLGDTQLPTYRDTLELFGVVHRIIRPYRRRIINPEL